MDSAQSVVNTTGCQQSKDEERRRGDSSRREKAKRLKSQIARLTKGVEYIDYQKFSQLMARPTPPLLVDVREPEEIAVSTLPSAITLTHARQLLHRYQQNHNYTHFQNVHLHETPDVICFCTVGLRSGVTSLQIVQQGMVNNVWNYSIMSHLWEAEGEVPFNRVHLFAKKYEQVMPSGFSYVAFPTFTALARAFALIPFFLSTFARRFFSGISQRLIR